MKLMPGNAGPGIVVPVSFGPDLLSPWTGFAVFVAEIAAARPRGGSCSPLRRSAAATPTTATGRQAA